MSPYWFSEDQVKGDKVRCNDVHIYDMCQVVLTKHIQSADVSWNKPCKEMYCSKYQDWLLSSKKLYTKGGNMRATA